MITKKLTVLVETYITVTEPGKCDISCQHLRGLGREYSCTLFEHPLLVDVDSEPGQPLRCWRCRVAERATQRILSHKE